MAEACQRWRLVVRRGEAVRALPHREVESEWADGLDRAAIPVAMSASARPRPRIVFAAPVPVGLSAEHEPIDLFLAERLTIADLRTRLAAALPPGHDLVDLHDVWIGEPSIAGRVVAADYRAELAGDPAGLEAAVSAMLDARRLDRLRPKGGDGRSYDLRALIAELEALPSGDGPSIVRMRLRHDPELGTGRPEEVLAALGDLIGREVIVRTMVRERLWLAGEPE